MADFLVTAASVLVFGASWSAVALAAGVRWAADNRTLRHRALAFCAAAFAVFWTFRGYPILHSVFSGTAFQGEAWKWLARWSFDFSLGGWLNFLGISLAIAAYVAVFAVLVGMTLWKIPTLDRSRQALSNDLAAFVVLLALDYAWLSKVPMMFL